MEKYRVLLYRTQTRHKLIMRFKSYKNLANWAYKNNIVDDGFYKIRCIKKR